MENLKVSVYELDFWEGTIDVRLERVQQIDGSDLWAIREKGCCLNKQGEWEIEPIPSSRTSAFYKRCRWKSAEAALKTAQLNLGFTRITSPITGVAGIAKAQNTWQHTFMRESGYSIDVTVEINAR